MTSKMTALGLTIYLANFVLATTINPATPTIHLPTDAAASLQKLDAGGNALSKFRLYIPFFMSAPAVMSVRTDKTLFKLLIDELFQTGPFSIETSNFALMNPRIGQPGKWENTGGARDCILYDKPIKRSKYDTKCR